MFIRDLQHHAGQIGKVMIAKSKLPERIAQARIEPRGRKNQVWLKAIRGLQEALLKSTEYLAAA